MIWLLVVLLVLIAAGLAWYLWQQRVRRGSVIAANSTKAAEVAQAERAAAEQRLAERRAAAAAEAAEAAAVADAAAADAAEAAAAADAATFEIPPADTPGIEPVADDLPEAAADPETEIPQKGSDS
ncbi:hypothetical protein BH24ACT5_BH24ACT5_10480 [soil metagenome]